MADGGGCSEDLDVLRRRFRAKRMGRKEIDDVEQIREGKERLKRGHLAE